MFLGPKMDSDTSLVSYAAEIVSAYVSNNSVQAGEVAGLIAAVHASLKGLGEP